MLDAGGLGADLSEEIDIHRVVDGHKVVQLCHNPHVVGVAYRSAHAGRVIVQIVVELLRACAEAVHLTALVDGLVRAGDLACLGDIHERVHIHLRMYAQIL